VDEISQMLDNYERQREKGREWIARSWSALRSTTKARLSHSGHFGEHGQQLKPEDSADEVERLESAIGACKAAVDATFPRNDDDPIVVAAELLNPDIESSSHDILASGYSEPAFLRLALRASILHERAKALTALTSKQFRELSKVRGGGKAELAGILFDGAALFALPLSMAVMLSAAAAQNIVTSTVGAYFVVRAISGYLRFRDHGRGERSPDDESREVRTYHAWQALSFEPVVGGVGIDVRLREIAGNRIRVPLHIYDLSHHLTACLMLAK